MAKKTKKQNEEVRFRKVVVWSKQTQDFSSLKEFIFACLVVFPIYLGIGIFFGWAIKGITDEFISTAEVPLNGLNLILMNNMHYLFIITLTIGSIGILLQEFGGDTSEEDYEEEEIVKPVKRGKQTYKEFVEEQLEVERMLSR